MNLYIVTGTTQGLGKALADAIGSKPDNELIALARAPDAPITGGARLEVDLSDLDAVDRVFDRVVDRIRGKRFAKSVALRRAARATAAIPTDEAKAAAWERLFDEGLSNREFEAVSDGFWDAEQTGLVHDYLPRYLHEGLAAARRRGPSFEERLGDCFPLVPFADGHVAELAEVLRDDVPTVLRRAWEDAYDDLTRTR